MMPRYAYAPLSVTLTVVNPDLFLSLDQGWILLNSLQPIGHSDSRSLGHFWPITRAGLHILFYIHSFLVLRSTLLGSTLAVAITPKPFFPFP